MKRTWNPLILFIVYWFLLTFKMLAGYCWHFLFLQSRQTLRAYAASVAARGLIHSNSTKSGIGGNTSSGSGWKPLHKPQWFAVNKQVNGIQCIKSHLTRRERLCINEDEKSEMCFLNVITVLSNVKCEHIIAFRHSLIKIRKLFLNCDVSCLWTETSISVWICFQY